MRGHDDAVIAEELNELVIVDRFRTPVLKEVVALVLVDVEPNSTKNTFGKALNECLSIDQASAGSVDEDDTFLELVEHRLVDCMFRGREEGHHQEDDVTLLIYCVIGHILSAHRLDIVILKNIVSV